MLKDEGQDCNPAIWDPTFQQAFLGHTIHVVAPASGVHPTLLQRIQSLPAQMPFDITLPDHLLASTLAYHANTDANRFNVLKKALFSKTRHTIIWALRGGYGSARLIDALAVLPKPAHPKTVIGCSDITALHLFLAQQWGWQTLHGANFSQWVNPEKDPQNLQKLAALIAPKMPVATLESLVPLNTLAHKSRQISGRLTGGNLSLVQTSLGTVWHIKTRGKIIFLEDTHEAGYRIDRMLYHLTQAGIFTNAQGVVLGDFTGSDEHLSLALTRFANDVPIPVFKTPQFGHGAINYPLIYHAHSVILWDEDLKTHQLIMRGKGQ